MLSAVEPSADRLGAALVRELQRQLPGVELFGLGGPLMEEAGLQLLAPPAPAAMGLVELFAHFAQIRQRRQLLYAGLQNKPDAIIGIDAPDFHLPVLSAARRLNILAVGVVAPQVWAWRPGRARSLGQKLDLLLCLFRFEPQLFLPHGLDARWIGHPATELPPAQPEADTLALFPGSRPAERALLLPIYRQAATLFGASHTLLALPPGVEAPPGPWEPVSSAEALRRASRALSKSGTVTLELALAGVPTVVAHRVPPLTWWVGRLLVRGIRHLALPNILLDRQESCQAGPGAPVPEYLQHLEAAELVAALRSVSPPPSDRLRQLLAPPDDRSVAERAVEAIVERLSLSRSARR